MSASLNSLAFLSRWLDRRIDARIEAARREDVPARLHSDEFVGGLSADLADLQASRQRAALLQSSLERMVSLNNDARPL